MGRNLEEMRQEIETMNSEFLGLLSRRGRLVEEIFELKVGGGLPVHDPGREIDMLEQLVEENRGPYSDEVVRSLFRELFAASLTLTTPAADG
jgi:3-deoxy-7-phosphoheptulonate synthase/chorismate mutase